MTTWGGVTLERHRELQAAGIHLHVWHDGVDVTGRCVFADDTGEGQAKLLALNEGGHFYVDRQTGEPAVVTVRGIAIVEGEPLAP